MAWAAGDFCGIINFLSKYYQKVAVAALDRREASKVIIALQHILAAKKPRP